MGAHSPAEKLLKHWLRIASVGLWAAESRAAKLVKRTFAFLISCVSRIEMLGGMCVGGPLIGLEAF